MSSNKAKKLQEIKQLHDTWLKSVLFGKDSISSEEFSALKAYGKLPLNIDLSKSLALIDKDFLQKADVGNPMKTPAGPKTAKPDVSIQGSTQLAGGSGKPKGKDRSNLVPVSKKDHPKRPAGAVDETDHTWYVRPGGAKKSAEKEEETERKTQAKQVAKRYDKTEHLHREVLSHLKDGKISSMKPLGEEMGGITESYRIIIEGNGSGVMKPHAQYLSDAYEGGGEVNGVPLVGAGAGTIPPGTQVQREQASYKAALSHGLSSHVPPTSVRTHGGKAHSVQKWEAEMAPTTHALRSKFGEDFKPSNYTSSILSLVPADKAKEVEKKLNDSIVFDIVQNNNDRHLNNIIWNDNFTDFRLIDNSLSFGNGVDGCRNNIHAELHNSGRKVTISEDLHTRMSNMSLGDYKKSLEGLEDYEVGQAFLRNRYLLYLQETEGHIDFEKFRPVHSTVNNEKMGSRSLWDRSDFQHRKENKLLPNDLFEGWAKGYLQKVSKDSSHPDYKSALELVDIGVFMGPGHAKDPKGYRALNKHEQYEATISPQMELPSKLRRDTVKDPKDNSKAALYSTQFFDFEGETPSPKASTPATKKASTPVTKKS